MSAYVPGYPMLFDVKGSGERETRSRVCQHCRLRWDVEILTTGYCAELFSSANRGISISHWLKDIGGMKHADCVHYSCSSGRDGSSWLSCVAASLTIAVKRCHSSPCTKLPKVVGLTWSWTKWSNIPWQLVAEYLNFVRRRESAVKIMRQCVVC